MEMVLRTPVRSKLVEVEELAFEVRHCYVGCAF